MASLGPESIAIPVYVNSKAGRGRSDVSELRGEAARGALPVKIHPVAPTRLLPELERAVAALLPVVGVAGGDGSLRTAANVFAGSGTALAPVPAGTLNRFCRRLGISTTGEAFASLADGEVRSVALGVADDQLFLNTAVFGLYADVVRRRERMRSWLGKWPAAAVSSVIQLSRLPLMSVTIDVQGAAGRTLARRTPVVWVGLGWGTFPFVHEAAAPRPRSTLEVAVLRPVTRRGMALLVARMLARIARRERPLRLPEIEFLHARQIVLRAKGVVGVTLDGEPLRFRGPILVRVQDDALRVVAPPASSTTREESRWERAR